jgi:hypothetical protein
MDPNKVYQGAIEFEAGLKDETDEANTNQVALWSNEPAQETRMVAYQWGGKGKGKGQEHGKGADYGKGKGAGAMGSMLSVHTRGGKGKGERGACGKTLETARSPVDTAGSGDTSVITAPWAGQRTPTTTPTGSARPRPPTPSGT